MATDIESRKLMNLRVIDLRTELAKRNLDKTGAKNELIERLQKALIADGHDPEEYVFEIDTPDYNLRTSKSKEKPAQIAKKVRKKPYSCETKYRYVTKRSVERTRRMRREHWAEMRALKAAKNEKSFNSFS